MGSANRLNPKNCRPKRTGNKAIPICGGGVIDFSLTTESMLWHACFPFIASMEHLNTRATEMPETM